MLIVADIVKPTKPIINIDEEEERALQEINIDIAPQTEIKPFIAESSIEGVQWDNTKEFISCIISNSEAKIEEDTKMKNIQYTLKDAADGKTSVMNITLPSEKYRKTNEDTELPKKQETETPKPIIIVDTKPSLEEEPLIKRSSAIAIKLMGQRNLLKDVELLGKRKHEEDLTAYKPGEINIQYRDKHGNLLTRREAFNLQCNSFHGIAESKTRQEKKKKKALMETKGKTMDHSKDSALSRALAITQQTKAQPYMVIQRKKVSTIF